MFVIFNLDDIMTISAFSHLAFFVDPIKTLAFFAIAMSLLSLWIRKTAWLWASFAAISLILAVSSHIIHPVACIPLGLIFFLGWILHLPIKGLLRLTVFGSLFIIAAALCFHFIPGFTNWNLASKMRLSQGGLPYDLWMNYDKAFVGLLLLVWYTPLIQTIAGWKELLYKSALWILACVCILLFLSQILKVVAWDPKLPSIFLPWLFINWIFVVIPEEALLRGVLLKELCVFFGGKPKGKILALLVSTLIFTLFHLAWIAYLPFLLLVFVAGLSYGALYLWTGKIESSILCHGIVNTLHFLLFTYPALASIAT